MSGGGRPDYEIKIKHRDQKYATKVGAAWKTQDGRGINIRLDPGVSVATPDGVFLTLWPFETKEEREQRFGGGGQRGDSSRSFGNGGGGSAKHSVPPEDDFGGDDSLPF